MATQLFFRDQAFLLTPLANNWTSGTNEAKLDGTNSGWARSTLSTSRGVIGAVGKVGVTVAGPTNGIEITQGGTPYSWISPPLSAGVTISGTITLNLWASESNMSANVAINARIVKISGSTGAITQIAKSSRTTEVAVTTSAVNSFTVSPTSTALARGDRIGVIVFGDDAGTMGSGQTFTFDFDATSAGTTGDSYVTFTETFGFDSAPAGTTIYPTSTSSLVGTASVDLEAWTSRGGGVQTSVTNTTAGWTPPIQITDTAGGTVIDWFTRPLQAFTLGGPVLIHISAKMSTSVFGSPGCEIAIVENDGSSPVVWGIGRHWDDLFGFTEAAQEFWVAGDDTAVSAGQRLRIRLFIDDSAGSPMTTGATATFYYAGTSGGASGDTFLTFTQTLSEDVVVDRRPLRPFVVNQAVNRASSW